MPPHANSRSPAAAAAAAARPGRTPPKPAMSVDPSSWLNFSLPPRTVPGSGGLLAAPRRSRRGEGWRGSALTREKFVNASFRFVLKPTETLSYGAHFADPDIALHWPHILQILVPTFSSYSVAQGYVSDADADAGVCVGEGEDEAGEEAAERKRRVEEEKQGRTCPICLSKPVAGRMTKCGHIFCFPCILHYIQLSDVPKSAKCPICGDTVHEGMLKSVRYLDAWTMIRAADGDDDGATDAAAQVATPRANVDGHGHGHAHAHAPDSGVFGQMDGFEETAAEAQAIDDETAAAGEHAAVPPAAPGAHRIHMRLLQRPQMTTLALPAAPTWPSDAVPPHTAPWHFLPDVLTFSRFMLASPAYMLGELERELAELDAEQHLLRADPLGREFVRAAQEKVRRQVVRVRDELMTDLVKRHERQARNAWAEAVGWDRGEREERRERELRAKEKEQHDDVDRAQRAADGAEVPLAYLATSDAAVYGAGPTVRVPPNVAVEPNPMPAPSTRRKKRPAARLPPPPPTPAAPSYHFYQSALGANVFLHPLDIRILLAHFKAYSLFPARIAFTSTGYDAGTINDDLRRRCKYLSHLPAGTEVVFVEAELEPLVGRDALAPFEQALKARRNKRRDRTKREDRAKSKAEAKERDKMPAPTRIVGSAEDELALALARSALEAAAGSDADYPEYAANGFAPSSASSSAWDGHDHERVPYSHGHYDYDHRGHGHGHPPPASAPAWPARPSFASALHRPALVSARTLQRHEPVDWGRAGAVWDAIDHDDDNDGDVLVPVGGERETEKGGGRRKKGGKKTTLVLGGGGGRRA
ncbi:hypothetical protein Q5752_001193 [Cryptotrichosporon argae]